MKLFDIMIKRTENKDDLLVRSKSEARKLIQNRGVKINDFTVIDQNADVFYKDSCWFLIEKNRLTLINTKDGTINSKNITDEEYEVIKKDLNY